jgi:hypothetical protein
METGNQCTEQHFLMATNYFGPFQNNAMVKLAAKLNSTIMTATKCGEFRVFYSSYQISNTKTLEEITHCGAVTVQFAALVCKQAMINVFINTHFIFHSIFITSCIRNYANIHGAHSRRMIHN